jgi:putative ABC transport system permease protein
MAWHHRVWNLVRQRRLSDEIDEELRFHIDSAERRNIAAGMPPDEARSDAIRRFGNAAVVRERTRDADLFLIADTIRQDVGFAVRSLRRNPAFAAMALLTLALGIGATTAIFTVVRSVLLRPLPFPDPDALQVISYGSPAPAWLYPGMSDEGYLEFREANRTFETLATFASVQSTLTGAGDAVRISGATVTTDFFRVLGVDAAAGRTFGPEDDRQGSENVVLLGSALWRGRFGAEPAVLNRTVTLNGIPHRVAGIMPDGFSYPAEAEYWIPLTVRLDPRLGYTRPVIGRLKSGVTREQAQADLDTWASQRPPDPRRPRDLVARVTSLHDAMVGDVRLPLLVFAGGVSFLLLIVCANVANLLLMRAVSRRQEIATRLALGASRARLVRQLLTESAVLSIAGGLAGIGIAALAGPALVSSIPPARLPQDIQIGADGWVLAFTAGLSLLTGLVVGLAPIVQTTRDEHFDALRAGNASATRRSRHVRHALVVAQVALTLMLLIGAGLLVKSFATLRGVPLGFTPDRVMTMTMDLPASRYPSAADAVVFHERLLESLSALPGVESAAVVNWLPLGDMVIWGDVQAEDRGDLRGKYNATKVAIGADYFRTMGIRVVRGRTFTVRDHRGSQPVIIVSESVARRLWPDGDAIGRRMALNERPEPGEWLTVVGVVEDIRQQGFASKAAHAVYQPYQQVTNRFFVGYMTFLVRTTGEPAVAAPMMRAALTRIDPNEAPQSLATLEAVIDRTVAEPRLQAQVLAAFSIAALLLAVVGIYGVLASSVLERRFEIGIRMTLGADAASVVRLMLRSTLLLTTIGVVLGLSGALALTGLLQSLLFDVAPTDSATFIASAAIVLVAAIGAAVLPARRASTTDPLRALRAE